jgi:hypothetical protein
MQNATAMESSCTPIKYMKDNGNQTIKMAKAMNNSIMDALFRGTT